MELLAVAKRAIPFLVGLAVGIIPSFVFSPLADVSPVVVENSVQVSGKSYCDTGRKKFKAYRSSVETPLAVQSKPTAVYTEAARRSGTEGIVKLKVEFLSDGTIGNIKPLSELPHGLTEQATNAAKKIRFRPAAVDGVAVDSTKMVEYSFSVY